MSFDMSSADTSLMSAATDDQTAPIAPVTDATTIFTPEFTQNFTPNLDPAFSPEVEYAIYRCGTFAPGRIHEPCQHSTTMVLCCACAGCTTNLWACGRQVQAASWLTHRLGQMVHNPWVALMGLVIEAYAMVQLLH